MTNWLKRIVGLALVAYIAWLAFNVIYGITVQVIWFCSDSFLLELFKMTMYMYIGSWITYITFILSGILCLRASLSYTGCGKKLVLSGAFGVIGYIVGFITSSIHQQAVHLPGPYILAPIFVLIVGLLSRHRLEENAIYILAFYRFRK